MAGEAGIKIANSKANGNSVTISGNANVTQNVTGGKISNSQATTANKNNITISGNAKVGGYVVAADVVAGQTANGNSLTISGNANVTGNVLAAHVKNGDEANENNVTISGNANIDGNITGGGSISSSDTGVTTANNNKIAIKDNATVKGYITGGDSRKSEGQSNSNQITIGKDVNISGVTKIVGGISKAGYAVKNDINITNNIASTTTITGGEGNLSTDSNQISITGDINGTVIGGKSNRVTATGNTITVTGKVDGNITGGEGNTSAGNNNIMITGNISTGANGSGIIIGGKGSMGTATGNAIQIDGNVSASTTITGGDAKTDANQNTISVGRDVGSEIIGTVIGGKSVEGTADSNR
ncbi:MAG: hypothetical protein SOU37_05705, partial [Campylobacter lanienae]|nr:hypothetical protein [Campylobacter lanienae]